MKSNSNKYKQIQQLISQKKFNESLICIENNKKDLAKLDYFFLKAVVHRYLNKYSEALILLSEVNKISPIYGRSYQEFGHNYVKLENKEMALKSYTRAVRYNPALQASWLGILGLGNADKNLIELADKNIIYLKNLPPELKSVLSFIHEGKLKKADDLCRFFLINSPHHIEAMKLLAIICKKLHVYDDSEFLLESCLEFDPDNIDIKIEYIDTLLKRQKYAIALDSAKDLFKKNPDDLSCMSIMAITFQQTDKQSEAKTLYKKILDIDPNNYQSMVSIGHLYKNIGDIDKSISMYKKSYNANRYFGDAYWSLANLKTYSFSDKELNSLEEMVSDEYFQSDEKIYMHFALGKAYEDLKFFDKSFSNYKTGNELKLPNTKFSIDEFNGECKNQIDVCTSDLFEMKNNWGHK